MKAQTAFLTDVREMWANVLEFRGKIVVVKISGAIMQEQYLTPFLRDIVMLHQMGFKIVIVHGGGDQISAEMKRNGMTPQRIGGLRVTNHETMELITRMMGKVRDTLVTGLNQHGAIAIGISGEDNELLSSSRHPDDRLGRVGAIDGVNPQIVADWLERGCVVVVTPIARAENGESHNVNADTAAAALAVALKAEKIIWLTGVKGLFRDIADDESFIPRMSVDQARELRAHLAQTKAGSAALPRLDACLYVLEHGVHAAHILSFKIEDSLLLELLTDFGVGTMITTTPLPT